MNPIRTRKCYLILVVSVFSCGQGGLSIRNVGQSGGGGNSGLCGTTTTVATTDGGGLGGAVGTGGLRNGGGLGDVGDYIDYSCHDTPGAAPNYICIDGKSDNLATTEAADEWEVIPNKDSRFPAIRRATLAYCRQRMHDSGNWGCPDIVKFLRNCRQHCVLSLWRSSECYPASQDRSRTICHEYLATFGLTIAGSYVPFIALILSTGRWRVVDITYDDLERP